MSSHWDTCTCHHVRSPSYAHRFKYTCIHVYFKNNYFPGGIKMENQSDRVRDCGWQPAVDGWSFPALRSLTRLVFSVWPLMKPETTNGTSMWWFKVKYENAFTHLICSRFIVLWQQMTMMYSFASTIIVINIMYALNASHRDAPSLGKYHLMPFCNVTLSKFAVVK